MKISAKSGAALAAAAAGLLMAGSAISTSFAADAAMDAKGHCVGGNACKGHGVSEATKTDCEKIPGAKFEAAAAMPMPEKKM